jgi:branched-chain amino acid transport system permease protein
VEIFLDRLFAGLTAGSVYVMIALALVVVFRSSGTINFAQGEFALFTCFVAWWLTTQGWPLIVALVAAMAVGFVLGVSAERFLIRPVRKRNESAVLIVALGMFTALNGLDGWIWGPQDKLFPRMFPSGENTFFTIVGSRLHFDSIGIILAMIVVVVALSLLLNKTKLGLSMRAVATNPESAALSGVKIGRVLSTSWGISSALGAFAGVLLVPVLPPNQLNLSGFFPILIFASAAALLGGLDSIKGAVVGGLTFGVAESMINGYATFLHGSMQLTVAFTIIVAVLVVRPAGLFGSRRVERV